jgi:GDP-L-fucose synthase
MTGGESLAGRTVVVTGGTGFLGGAVTRQLHAEGAVVHALGSRDYNLIEQSEVRRLYRELTPEIVVHAAAAVGGIGANVANPGRFLYENALMGLMLIDEARLAGTGKFVLISSTCAYPQDAPLPLSEDDLWSGKPTGATGPYGMAKRLLHEACETYHRQYGFESSVLLLSNLYGPGDHFDPETSHVIPALIDRFVRATEDDAPSVTNWGSGRATREFIHVDDAARGIVAAVTRRTGPDPINLGTGVETSIREVSELIQAAAGYHGEVIWDTSKPDGQPRRYVSIERARRLLDFEPTVPLATGINQTVEWYSRESVR